MRKPAIRRGIAGFRFTSDPSSPSDGAGPLARRAEKRRRVAAPGAAAREGGTPLSDQAVKELPQPQPPVAFGLLKVNPEPCMDET